jgi:hypothetical protein
MSLDFFHILLQLYSDVLVSSLVILCPPISGPTHTRQSLTYSLSSVSLLDKLLSLLGLVWWWDVRIPICSGVIGFTGVMPDLSGWKLMKISYPH